MLKEFTYKQLKNFPAYLVRSDCGVVLIINGKVIVFSSYGKYKGKHVKSKFIEHIDGDMPNNHIDNLRLVNIYSEGLL